MAGDRPAGDGLAPADCGTILPKVRQFVAVRLAGRSARRGAAAVLAIAIAGAMVWMIYSATRDDPGLVARAGSAELDALSASTGLESDAADADPPRAGSAAVVAFGLIAVWMAGFGLTLLLARRRRGHGTPSAGEGA